MMTRRITAHILNRIILFIPALLLLGGVAYLVNPNYYIFDNGVNLGWDIVHLYRYMLFLPFIFKDVLTTFPTQFLFILEIIGPALLCVVALESMSIAWLKCHMGMKIVGLTLVSVKGTKVSFVQMVVRTLLKYFTLAFFPIGFVCILFNKERMTLHDKLSGTKVVSRHK